MHDRDTLIQLWEDAWAPKGGWTPFAQVLDGLSPEQAAWRPAQGRHSIWQIANHMAFWGEYVCLRARGGYALPDDEIRRRNWEEPEAIAGDAWRETVQRHARVREMVRDAIADPALPLDHLSELLTHHAYHTGQIMQIRALQGLAPVV